VKERQRYTLLKKEVDKEIEYFFEKRYVRLEPWHKRYFRILTAVFCVNLLARNTERSLYGLCSAWGDRYSRFAPATLTALRIYNKFKASFAFKFHEDVFLKDVIIQVNETVNRFCAGKSEVFRSETLIHGNTPLGVEVEFSNKGKTAGKFFESGRNDALCNFSKYNYYHLMKYMWRFGAYVDSEMPFKQFIKKGGFLEYTFIRPDVSFKPSEPLTSSPALAAKLIEESIKFTPVRPHSVHVTFQVFDSIKKNPAIQFSDIIFMMLCTGHFAIGDKGIYETRITEGNMKDWAVMRDRKNFSGWVVTVEFTHMRACRDFVRRKVYEPSILLLLAYKNIFNFFQIEVYSKRLNCWAQSPEIPKIVEEDHLAKVRRGLDMEVSLPEWYKDRALRDIAAIYRRNCDFITASVK
jgi:hypothetical protein